MSCYFLATRFYNHEFFSYQILYIMRLHNSITSPGVSSEEIFVGSCVARGVLDPVFPGDLQPGEWTSGDSKDAGRPWVLKGFPSQSFVDYTP